jgi:NarL family two-component system response regulator YdfI
VIVAASTALLRAGLEAVVRQHPSLDFAGTLTLGEVRDGFEEMRADVLLLWLPLLDEEWVGTLSEYTLPVVLLTDHPHPALVVNGFRANLRAVLSPEASEAEIVAAIQSAAVNLLTLQQSLFELFSPDLPRVLPELQEPLSARELEVLGLMSEGLSNKLVAHRLGISDHTVKFHVTSILAKLQAGSRTDAVMQGIRQGLILI